MKSTFEGSPPRRAAALLPLLALFVAACDRALLADAVRSAEALPRLKGMIVSRDGQIVLERYWRGAGPDRRTNVKSVSKSVLSALVGIAIARGDLRGVDQRVADVLPERFGPRVEPVKRAITVGHLLSMTAGLESTSFGDYGAWVQSRDWVGYVLSRPMEAAPGERMVYSTGSTHLLSAVLTRATGQSTYAYARRHLAGPLGIELRPWQRDPQGIYFGGNDMYLTPREMLRFGELYLDGGAYRGRQVVPRAWVEESFRPRTRSGWSGHAYGYGWWAKESGGHPVYFAWGYGGQYVFVAPSLRMVAVFVSEADGPRDPGHLPAIHAILDDLLVPAAEQALRGRADG